MKRKKLMVCPVCHSFYSTDSRNENVECDECKARLDVVDIDYEEYEAKTKEEKQIFKKEYLKYYRTIKKVPPFVPMEQSGWTTYIEIMGIIALIVVIAAGAMLIATGSWAAGIVTIFAGLASVGAIMLFVQVAKDVRHTRNQIDKLMYERKAEGK